MNIKILEKVKGKDGYLTHDPKAKRETEVPSRGFCYL